MRQVCAHVRDETRVRNDEKYGPKIGSLGFWMGKILTLTLRPPRKSVPTGTRYLGQKRCRPS